MNKKIILILNLIFLTFSIVKGQENLKVPLVLKVEANQINNSKYDISIIFTNLTLDTIYLPWNLSNIFYSKNDLPFLSIYFFDKKKNMTFLLKDNLFKVPLNRSVEILCMLPKSNYIKHIDIKLLFGKTIPDHQIIYVKYSNKLKESSGKKLHSGSYYSNKLNIINYQSSD